MAVINSGGWYANVSIKGLLKIAKIGTMTIPDRHKTVCTILWLYLGNTGIVFAMILDVLLIPSDTKFVKHNLSGIGNYCLVL